MENQLLENKKIINDLKKQVNDKSKELVKAQTQNLKVTDNDRNHHDSQMLKELKNKIGDTERTRTYYLYTIIFSIIYFNFALRTT